MATWLIPPLVGQKVMIDPSHKNAREVNDIANGQDGVLTNAINLESWFTTGSCDNKMRVIFPDGTNYRFHPNQLIPISGAYFEVERYIFGNGAETGLTRESRELLEYRIVKEGREFKHVIHDKEKRIRELEHFLKLYEGINQSHFSDKQIEEINMRYATVLDELVHTKETEPLVFNVKEDEPLSHDFVDTPIDAGRHIREELQGVFDAVQDTVIQPRRRMRDFTGEEPVATRPSFSLAQSDTYSEAHRMTIEEAERIRRAFVVEETMPVTNPVPTWEDDEGESF